MSDRRGRRQINRQVLFLGDTLHPLSRLMAKKNKRGWRDRIQDFQLVMQVLQWIWSWQGAVIALLLAAWAYVVKVLDSITWWQATLLFLASLVLIIILVNQWLSFRTKQRFDPKDYQELGEEISRFSSDALRALSDWSRSHPVKEFDPKEDGSGRRRWEADQDRRRERGQYFAEAFGSKSFMYWQLLSKLEIEIPFHAHAALSYEPTNFIVWLGMIGELLQNGYLDEARSFTKDDQFHMSTVFHG